MTMNENNSQPPSGKWSDFITKYLPGDLVQTEFGPAIITEGYSSQGDHYAVWPLPGWKWKRDKFCLESAKLAWYTNEELSLIERGPASIRRP